MLRQVVVGQICSSLLKVLEMTLKCEAQDVCQIL